MSNNLNELINHKRFISSHNKQQEQEVTCKKRRKNPEHKMTTQLFLKPLIISCSSPNNPTPSCNHRHFVFINLLIIVMIRFEGRLAQRLSSQNIPRPFVLDDNQVVNIDNEDEELRKTMRLPGANNGFHVIDTSDRSHATPAMVAHDDDHPLPWQTTEAATNTFSVGGGFAHLVGSDIPVQRGKAPKMVKRQDHSMGELVAEASSTSSQFISVLNNQSSIVFSNPSSQMLKPSETARIITITTNSTGFDKSPPPSATNETAGFPSNQTSAHYHSVPPNATLATSESRDTTKWHQASSNSSHSQANDLGPKVELVISAVNMTENQIATSIQPQNEVKVTHQHQHQHQQPQQLKLNRILAEASNKSPTSDVATLPPPLDKQRNSAQMISYTAVPQMIGKKSSNQQHTLANSTGEQLSSTTTRRPSAAPSSGSRRQELDEQWWMPRATNIFRTQSKQQDARGEQQTKPVKVSQNHMSSRYSNQRRKIQEEQQTTWSPISPVRSVFSGQATTQTNSFRDPPASEFGDRDLSTPMKVGASNINNKFRERQTTPTILDEFLASSPHTSLSQSTHIVHRPPITDQLDVDEETSEDRRKPHGNMLHPSASDSLDSSTEGIMVESYQPSNPGPMNEQPQRAAGKASRAQAAAGAVNKSQKQVSSAGDELLVGPFKSESEAPATITLSGVIYQKSGSSAAISSASSIVNDVHDINLASGSAAEPSTAQAGEKNKIGKGHHLYEDLDDDDDHHHSLLSSLTSQNQASEADETSETSKAQAADALMRQKDNPLWPTRYTALHVGPGQQQQTGELLFGYLGSSPPLLGKSPQAKARPTQMATSQSQPPVRHAQTFYSAPSEAFSQSARPSRNQRPLHQPQQQQQQHLTQYASDPWRSQYNKQREPHQYQQPSMRRPRVKQFGNSLDEPNSALFYPENNMNSNLQQWQSGEQGFYAAASENEVTTGQLSDPLADKPKQQLHLAEQHPGGPPPPGLASATAISASKHQSTSPIVIVQKDVKPVKYHLMRAYLKLRRLLRPFDATYVFPGEAHSTLMRSSQNRDSNPFMPGARFNQINVRT